MMASCFFGDFKTMADLPNEGPLFLDDAIIMTALCLVKLDFENSFHSTPLKLTFYGLVDARH